MVCMWRRRILILHTMYGIQSIRRCIISKSLFYRNTFSLIVTSMSFSLQNPSMMLTRYTIVRQKDNRYRSPSVSWLSQILPRSEDGQRGTVINCTGYDVLNTSSNQIVDSDYFFRALYLPYLDDIDCRQHRQLIRRRFVSTIRFQLMVHFLLTFLSFSSIRAARERYYHLLLPDHWRYCIIFCCFFRSSTSQSLKRVVVGESNTEKARWYVSYSHNLNTILHFKVSYPSIHSLLLHHIHYAIVSPTEGELESFEVYGTLRGTGYRYEWIALVDRKRGTHCDKWNTDYICRCGKRRTVADERNTAQIS